MRGVGKKIVLPNLAKIIRSPRAWRIGLGVLVVAAVVVLLQRFIDVDAVHAYADRQNGALVFALLTVLPLVGFPVSVLHIAAGIRFGFGLGMALVTLSIFLQLLASYALVRMWPNGFARRLAKVRARLPSAAHGTICLFTLLLPGVPFFIQNYTLAMIRVPFRTYLLYCLPLHTLRSVVTVGLGQQSGHFTPGGLTALGAYWGLVLVASWWAYRRLQRQLEDRRGGASDRTQPA